MELLEEAGHFIYMYKQNVKKWNNNYLQEKNNCRTKYILRDVLCGQYLQRCKNRDTEYRFDQKQI